MDVDISAAHVVFRSPLKWNQYITSNSATGKLFPDLPRTNKGWTEKTQVQFKLEGQGKPYVNKGKGVVNTGLGRAGGKETFEKQIIYFEKIGDVK
ncbi:hypothetical protein [Neisseria blantyrii]|uniref:hypothetical protein n=1 Tax=Neisseria blantyrii TaxID=2830647 RepID=UPI00272C62B7|nr:hypothetical protein [Neisseria blantyrii]